MELRDKYVGKKYGKLTILSVCRENGETMGDCLCECGNISHTYINKVVHGAISSCGCEKGNIKHRGKNTRLYSIWQGMKNRCLNPNACNYKYYGGKGIKICDEWVDNFEEFQKWSLSNGYSDNLTIDRIDVNGNYEPSNCRWATSYEQNNTHKSSVYEIKHNNEIYSLKEFCSLMGLSYPKIQTQLYRGKTTIEEIEEKYKGLSLREYQQRAMTTCTESSNNFSYMMLNLVGEVGEFAGKIAKEVRKERMTINNSKLQMTEGNYMKVDFEEDLKKEAGDILWEISGLCSVMGWSLEDIAEQNLVKLASRKERNVIVGDGDNR